MPKRSFATEEGYAATLHAIAHIEFNAINLGLDAAWRFGRNAQEELGEGLAFVKIGCVSLVKKARIFP